MWILNAGSSNESNKRDRKSIRKRGGERERDREREREAEREETRLIRVGKCFGIKNASKSHEERAIGLYRCPEQSRV